MIFLDNDVLLDVVTGREEFPDSLQLMSALEEQRVPCCTSALVLANTHFILRKVTNSRTALQTIQKLRTLFTILPLTQTAVDNALRSTAPDFEDALQYFACVEAEVDLFVTRNTRHFQWTNLAQPQILTPTQVLPLVVQY